MHPILFPLIAFILTAALTPFAIKIAQKYNFLDKPGGRKQHDKPVPPVGGLIIFPVFIFTSIFQNVPWPAYGWFFAAMALLLLTGAWDDRFNVRPWIKFAIHWVSALLIVLPGYALTDNLGDLFGPEPFLLGWMAIPFSVVATVLLINAINLMDGLDGLAGGTGLIVLFWLAVSIHLIEFDPAPVPLLIAALLGFLFYNLRTPWRKKAALFLGDSGSLALGLSIAWFCLGISQVKISDLPAIPPMIIAWCLALPIFDICGQFARRVKNGHHPFSPDSDHFHHHFTNAGIPAGQAVAVILSLVLLTGAIGVIGALTLPTPVLTWSWIICLFLHIFMSLKPERCRKIIKRLWAIKTKNQS